MAKKGKKLTMQKTLLMSTSKCIGPSNVLLLFPVIPNESKLELALTHNFSQCIYIDNSFVTMVWMLSIMFYMPCLNIFSHGQLWGDFSTPCIWRWVFTTDEWHWHKLYFSRSIISPAQCFEYAFCEIHLKSLEPGQKSKIRCLLYREFAT